MAESISCDVDDRAMLLAVGGMGLEGLKAVSRRSVLKTARLATVELKAATRAAMYDNPGGYDPYKAANFRVPRVRSKLGMISAGAGYSQEGSFDRFRSTGTGPRYRGSGVTHVSRSGGVVRTRDRGGGYTGIEQGFGMIQTAGGIADPAYPLISEVEMQIELKKRNL